MDSSVSTPHCSFIAYFSDDVSALSFFLQDFRAFFQKFPLHYELVLILEPPSAACQNVIAEATTAAPANERLRILKNSKKLGRARSILAGLDAAEGNYLALADSALATPLGDLFKILQHLITDTTASSYWGDRTLKKNSSFLHPQLLRHQIEHLFTPILRERHENLTGDILCEVGGFSRAHWLNAKKHLDSHKIIGWYVGADLQRSLQKENLKIERIFIHDSGAVTKDYKPWRVRWGLLRKCLAQSP